ncbi:Six-hairpin glycosidase-like protein [Fusarium flagelliforme]|uniref:Six-hairpin glycosidase-like protein n=1 Tax=Fusarium flagelliforme TaxID=2675880 RepID=UPI001E8CECF1|nr:Six-hairpin glycosidase-like protein [Fusarium flagelliforme]KAH7182409.1 Six-hairpin glycosidase-like protein [Fusarium flagelliforme]
MVRSFAVALLLQTTLVLSKATKNPVIYANNDTITLTSNGSKADIVVLDYGYSVEGHPTFEVVSRSGDTSGFELTFAESKAALNGYMSDGPLPLAAAMETYRVNKYNISAPGLTTNRLIQGAFRYQKLNLSTAGDLKLRRVGVKPTVHTTPLTELPGSFECSDADLTRIWHTGARTAQLTEIPKDTVPDFWQVTDEGSLVESAAPQALSGAGVAQATSYEIDFEVKPLTGEFVFSVLSDTLNDAVLITCDVETGAISTSTSASGKIPKAANVTVGEWISVHARVNMTDIRVSINNETTLNFTQTEKFYGAFGLGTPLGHSAYYRNLRATTLGGDELYSSSLTDRTFLDDFLMGNNPLDTIVDGSRRDRIAYAGDLDIAISSTFASTYGKSFVAGSLDLVGSFQTTAGFWIPNAKIQQAPLPAPLPINITGLIGYSFNLLNGLATNYEVLGNVSFAKEWAPRAVQMLDWAHEQLVDGLFTINDPSLTGDWNYYDPPQTGASTKFNALYAYSLQQTEKLLKAGGVSTGKYQSRLKKLRKAVHKQLWNETMGAYVLSNEITTGFSQDANALAILAGIPQANGVSAKSLLSNMEAELQLPAGPLAFSNSTVESGFAQKISPFSSAYHLRAAFESADEHTIRLLLKSLWAPMANPSNANYTNTFWETLDPDGSPGLGIMTSLCHGWAAGPTAELSKHVLGVQATKPGFSEWKVQPMLLGLGWAKGRVPTEKGTIEVEWKLVSDLLHMKIQVVGDKGTRGTVYLPENLPVAAKDSVFKVNGKVVKKTSFSVKKGEQIEIVQNRK